ncbi:MAG: hypothetical protein BWY82_00133 [Verrucomicrobia bacterium ADurb.Bin474]|nr:MAG: hypothetical protein BWY82_00133 [Verrucomicrobia bacterium ADurb.Bin474]
MRYGRSSRIHPNIQGLRGQIVVPLPRTIQHPKLVVEVVDRFLGRHIILCHQIDPTAAQGRHRAGLDKPVIGPDHDSGSHDVIRNHKVSVNDVVIGSRCLTHRQPCVVWPGCKLLKFSIAIDGLHFKRNHCLVDGPGMPRPSTHDPGRIDHRFASRAVGPVDHTALGHHKLPPPFTAPFEQNLIAGLHIRTCRLLERLPCLCWTGSRFQVRSLRINIIRGRIEHSKPCAHPHHHHA